MAGYRSAVSIHRSISAGVSAVLLVAAFFASGCSINRGDYTGEWSGKKGEKYDTPDETIAGTLDKVRLSIKASGEFMLIDGGVPKQGRVRFEANGANLEITRVLGRSMDGLEPVPIQLQGKDLKINLEGKDLLLTRIPTKLSQP
jgi:hypothetical protein